VGGAMARDKAQLCTSFSMGGCTKGPDEGSTDLGPGCFLGDARPRFRQRGPAPPAPEEPPSVFAVGSNAVLAAAERVASNAAAAAAAKGAGLPQLPTAAAAAPAARDPSAVLAAADRVAQSAAAAISKGLLKARATAGAACAAAAGASPAVAKAAGARPAEALGSSVAHDAEKLAKLPPKLRARLLARGIIKEQDLAPPAAPDAGRAAPGTPPEPAGGPGTPPEHPAAPGTPPDPEAQAPMLGSPPMLGGCGGAPFGGMLPPGAAPIIDWHLMAFGVGAVGLPPLGVLPKAAALPPATAPAPATAAGMDPKAASFNWVAAAASAKAAPPSVQTVYSSAPVIKRLAEIYAEAPVAKRQHTSEDPAAAAARAAAVVSPAAVRAAAAKAAAEKAPTWIYKDGVVTEVGAAAAAAAAAAATPEPEPELLQPVVVPVAAAAAEAPPPLPPGPPPPGGPPLPPGWIRVPHESDFYYWNTSTQEVSWEHPAGGDAEQEEERPREPQKPKFSEEHKILWTDLGKIIGRQGINLKIIKCSIGCDINVPRSGKGGGKGGKGKDKGKDKGKGKSKGTKGEAMEKGIGRGIGTGEKKLEDDQFVTVSITADTPYAAKGGKRCLEVMLGYGRHVEAALALLGVEVKMPSVDEMTNGKATLAANSKDGIDPMDPASYSDAPVGSWGAGMKKDKGRNGGGGREPDDAKTANAERC